MANYGKTNRNKVILDLSHTSAITSLYSLDKKGEF